MKVVVLGCSGMLGSVLTQSLTTVNKVFGVSRTTHSLADYICDFNNHSELTRILDEINADVIVNAAAITDLQFCEKNIYSSFELHFELSRFLALRVERNVYISTDSVFNGESGGYSETSNHYPVNIYAMSKLLGEYPILDSGGLILRTNIYGFNQYRQGNSLLEWAISSILQNKKITGFTDVYFNPVSVYALSEIIAFCIKNKKTGLFHIGSNESVSKAEFLRRVISVVKPEYCGIDFETQPESNILRPKNTTLDIRKSIKHGFPKVDLDNDLKLVISQYFSKVFR